MKDKQYTNSLSTCDLYDNPFNLRQQMRQELVKQRQDQYVHRVALDKTSQSALEKRMFLAFQERNFELFPQPFGFIGKVVRFCFLILVVPFHVVFYKIPKWFFVIVVPKVNFFIRSSISQIQLKIQKKKAAISAKIKKKKDLLITPIFSRIEKLKEWYRRKKERVQGLKKGIQLSFSRYIASFKKIGSFFGFIHEKRDEICKKIVQLKEDVRKALIRFPQIVLAKLKKAPYLIKEKLLKVQKAKEDFFAPFWHFLDPRNKRVYQSVKKHKEAYQEKFIAKIKEWVVGPKQTFQKIKQVVIDYWAARIRSVLDVRSAFQQKFWIQVKDLKEQKKALQDSFYSKIRNRYENSKQGAVTSCVAFKNVIKREIKRGGLWFFHRLPSPLRNLLRYLFVGLRFLKRFWNQEGFKRYIANGKSRIGNKVSHLRVVRYVKNGFQYFVKTFRLLESGIIWGILILEKGCKSGVYAVRLGAVCVKVLWKHGMEIVRDKTRLGMTD